MLKTLKNAWRIPELKSKLLFTLLIIVLYRLGANIPVPYVDPHAFDLSVGSIFQYMDLLAGGALSQATLFALSVSPYITASIVMQLLTVAIPTINPVAIPPTPVIGSFIMLNFFSGEPWTITPSPKSIRPSK